MKLVTYKSADGPRVAVPRDGGYVDLNWANPSPPACMKQLLSLGKTGLDRAAKVVASALPLPDLNPGAAGPRARPAEDHLHRPELRGPRQGERHGEPPPSRSVFNKFPTAVGRARRRRSSCPRSATRSTTRPSWSRSSARRPAHRRDEGHGACGRLRRGPRRLGPRLAAQKPGKQWMPGKIVRHVRAVRPRAGDGRRGRRPRQARIRLRLNGQTMQDS